MIRFSKIWCCLVIVVSAILVADLNILLAQTNDSPDSEKTNPSDSTQEVDPATKVEIDNKSPKIIPTERTEPILSVEVQRRFNELEREYLNDRADYIDMWLALIAIVLTFFAVVIAIAGYIGFREFRRLRDEASQHVKESQKLRNEASQHVAEIRKDKAESNELMQNMRQRGSTEVIDLLNKDEGFKESLRELLGNPELSVIDKAIAEASALQQEGVIKDAIEKWRSIANIMEETDNDLAALAWFSVGYLHSQEEELEKAILAFDRAIYLKPDYVEAYSSRGVSKGELSQYEIAILDLDKAIILDPDDAEAYYNLGIVYFKCGSYYSACGDFDKAIRLKPGHTPAHINRGLSRFNLGQYEDAFSDLDKAITFGTDDVEAYYNRGMMSYLISKGGANFTNFDEVTLFESAKSDFQTALELAIQQGLTELITIIEEQLHELNDVE